MNFSAILASGAVLCAFTIPAVAQQIPAGAVMAFDLKACPSGWAEFKNARGRVVLGANPSIPSTDGKKGENGLSARVLGTQGGHEEVVLSDKNIPPHKHNTINLETMQAAGDFRGHPTLTVPGRDANAKFTGQIVGDGDQAAAPFEITPPFVVLTICKKT
ncbi:hypothetical protein [Hyphomicrobium sp. LHD-15]|uniref:hypothetical protein n=1 Tax=Hyphomicrobium sp. LHD-15 TaxID=3072142 RepID=UPI00280CF5A7|nr:hypothetical protein [Hyphomicrobium sp. LHD-15]MDQ8699803.1 hypothetical protein [Hyphomicrobium sp. LHD-15]